MRGDGAHRRSSRRKTVGSTATGLQVPTHGDSKAVEAKHRIQNQSLTPVSQQVIGKHGVGGVSSDDIPTRLAAVVVSAREHVEGVP